MGLNKLAKLTFIIVFVVIILFSPPYFLCDNTTINLGVISTGVMDIASDNNNTIHIIWSHEKALYYGQVYNGTVVNKEKIPYSYDFKTKFVRPRLSVSPDGKVINLSWINASPSKEIIHVWRKNNEWNRELVWRGETDGSFYAAVPFVVSDLSGTFHAIAQLWTSSGFNKIAYWYRRERQTSWSGPYTLISADDRDWRETSMFVDKNGGIHAVFKSGRDPGRYIYAPNGKLLKDYKPILIPIPPGPGANCVSMGDLFVDKNFTVHHAFITYKRETIDYAEKKQDTGFQNYSQPSNGSIKICHPEKYENPWPSIAVAPWGEIFVTWADMPCPSTIPNRINLSIKSEETDKWRKTTLTNSAHIDSNSKPAITANEEGVFLLYRNSIGELMLYVVTEKEYINKPPKAIIKYSPQSGLYPLTVNFDGSDSYDPDGEIVKWEWSVNGIKSIEDKKKIQHTFQKPGKYFVFLTVTDNEAAKSTAKVEVEVYNIKSPINQTFYMKVNKSLFSKEYFYIIKWEKNPWNEKVGANIVKYIIYRKKNKEYTKIGSVSSSNFVYYDRSLKDNKQNYYYYVTALDDKGRESPIEETNNLTSRNNKYIKRRKNFK